MVKPNEKQKRKKRPCLTAVTFLIFTHPPPPPTKNYRSPLAYASRGIGGFAPLNPHPSPGRQESRTRSALLLNRVFQGKVSRVRFAAILTRSLRPPLGASGLRLPVAPLTLAGTEKTEQQEFFAAHQPMRKPDRFRLPELNGHQNAVDGFLGAFRGEVTQKGPGARTESLQQAERTAKRGYPEISSFRHPLGNKKIRR